MVACLALSRIANFDDLDPLAAEPGVKVIMVKQGDALPAGVDLVIIPGSKSTRGDLAFLRAQGWDVDVLAHVRRGGAVLGICGGYQMLGRVVRDPEGIEGPAGETPGLGLLDVETVMSGDKMLTRISGEHVATGRGIEGYEIHIGRTEGPDRARPFARVGGAAEGAVSADGRIMGSYLHGLFSGDGFRQDFLKNLGVTQFGSGYGAGVEAALDALADHLEAHLDVDKVLGLAKLSI